MLNFVEGLPGRSHQTLSAYYRPQSGRLNGEVSQTSPNYNEYSDNLRPNIIDLKGQALLTKKQAVAGAKSNRDDGYPYTAMVHGKKIWRRRAKIIPTANNHKIILKIFPVCSF